MSNKPSFPAESSSDNGQNNAELALLKKFIN